MTLLLWLSLLILSKTIRTQTGPTEWSTSPFNPPSLPLAVKIPYMNAWEPQGNAPTAMSNSFPKIGSTFFSVSIIGVIIYTSTLTAIIYRTWDGTA